MLILLAGCKDFIEPSIEKREVKLLAPANLSEGTQYSQTFWWQGVEDALKYRLQIVTPNFEAASRLILDTVINLDKFNFTLEPGNYEWRVRAENGSSQTAYSKSSFVIHPSTIEEQKVQLVFPANNFVTNQSSTVFKWLALYGAETYQLQIDTSNFEDENKLFFDKTTPNQEFSVTMVKDKLYKWRVKALNATVQSKWSVTQNLIFDKTPPGKVFLTAPLNDETVSKSPNLRWEALADAKKYQLYVFKSDGTSLYSNTFPLIVTAANYTFAEGKSGEKVFWQVRALDDAGNFGAYSELRGFSIQ